MKKISPLIFGLCVLSLTAFSARAQEIFDLLLKGDGSSIKSMIEKDPKLVEARDKDGNTLLHHAASAGNTDLVRFLVEKGLSPDIVGATRQTPLHLAAISDRTEAVAALLEKKASVDARDDYQRTALVLCARQNGEVATGRLLVDAGADINSEDRFGSTALELAAWRGKRAFVDLLLEKGARIPDPGQKWGQLVWLAATEGLDNLFVPAAAKIRDLKGALGEGLVHAAAAGGSAAILGLLLERGYDPAKPDRFGWTPLHYAARDGRTEAARILIEKGAPLDARTIMGQTAFNIARERSSEAVAALLLEKGALPAAIVFPVLSGDYLGETPSAGQAKLFGLGIISSIWGLHSPAVFSPDGNEVYWKPMIAVPGENFVRGDMLTMKRVGGKWTAPAAASFSGQDFGDDVPFFAPDGKRIYFLSQRPLPGETKPGNEKIWYADRTASGNWAEPQPLDPRINEHNMHWNFSVDKDRNVYFAGRAPDTLGQTDIYFARWAEGRYEKPVNLGKPINSPEGDEMPFVARDGSYLLFARQFDIWVSFRGEHGAWEEPVKLGPEVNSPAIDICPVVTDDGKYLFFLSQRDGESHAYWVGTEVFEKLRPKRQ